LSEIGSLINTQTGVVLLTNVKWCEMFFCKLRGLMFRANLRPGEGLLMVEVLPGIATTAIHMLFMRFEIGVIWLDSDFQVVDLKLAKPWRLFYAPAKAALYTLETSPDLLAKVAIGDHLRFDA
jgi:uncharacterized membrane protein (UPF0127 family)